MLWIAIFYELNISLTQIGYPHMTVIVYIILMYLDYKYYKVSSGNQIVCVY